MDSDLMNEKDFNWIKSTELDESGLQSAYDIIDVLILYLSVANNPDLPDNLRAFLMKWWKVTWNITIPL